ncbi:MAG: glycosyltransferase family 2 protein [Bacteroidetes bacterium]|nr:glycosyltransferase family 2 protein [Bacteroidota bacterium]
MDNPKVSIVVPLYNEEKAFDLLIGRLKQVMLSADYKVETILVNDGSSDRTAFLIEKIASEDERFVGLLLSRNHGHQLAVTAGLSVAKGTDAVMIIDGDLQDPPELLLDFYKKLKEGYDVIYAVRKNRKESSLKKIAYWFYYRLQQRVSNFKIPLDSGDFSMISRRVVDYMNQMPEQSRYLRGMRSWVGFKQFGFEYNRDARAAGEAKYGWKKLFELAFNGIFNFSDFPVRFISRLGIMIILLSFVYIVYVLVQKLFFGNVPEGFTTLIIAITLFSGVQLISIGLIGEYVLRIYNQVRNRPLFVIDKIISKSGQ